MQKTQVPSCRNLYKSCSWLCSLRCLIPPRGRRWQVDRSTSQGQVYLWVHGSNVSPGPAAVGDKPVSIKSIVMITTEIKHPTWHCLSIPQTAAFGAPIMSARAGMSTLRGNSHFDNVSSICLKFFLVPFFFLAALLLGLQKLPVLVTHSKICAVQSVLEYLLSTWIKSSRQLIGVSRNSVLSKCTIQLNRATG